jgi:hypothetical protein
VLCEAGGYDDQLTIESVLIKLNYSMSDVKGKLDELSHGKQDIASAISLDDVNVAVSRAIDHADRRADNIIKSIGGA